MIVRSIAPEGMPRAAGAEGQALLDEIWAHFKTHQSWPTFDDIDRKLYAAGRNYEEAVQQLCPALLRGISSDILRMPQGSDPLSLTIAGAANCADADSVLDEFLRMVRTAASIEPHFRSTEPGEQPRLLPKDLDLPIQSPKARLKIKLWDLMKLQAFKAAALGLHEPCFRGGATNVADLTWSLVFDRGIRPYASVQRLDDYWRVRERVAEPDRVEAENRPFHKGPASNLLPPPPQAPVVPLLAGLSQKAPSVAAESSEPMSVTCTLHPLIATVAEERYRRGAYNDAVRSAFQEVEHRVATLVGGNLVGAPLMGMAFGTKPDPPKIKVTRFTGASLDSEQTGMQFLFKGAMHAVRNPLSHGPDEKFDRDEAEEMLVFASFLMRRLDIEDDKRKAAASSP
ncbi:TIGR02391 family protein [Streptomyces sp. GbtcB7]|uniref:TIGR02391 family protein n=1 Tax=Streptomyces sp. GbtcB7 TaxID=2824752 RepID=UPI0027E5793A|nr:TIGR02391 family protein [Streptomyces sp. GbtcB7]